MDKSTLKVKYGDEKVLTIKNKYLAALDECETNRDKVITLIELTEKMSTFEYRYDAELDFERKQVIPYVVLKHEDKYFVTKRIKGDSRLVGGLSIAVGGHINPCDLGSLAIATINKCIDRELAEETTVLPKDTICQEFVTTFVDNSSEVSSVHVCLLVLIELNTNNISIREADKLEGCWMDNEEILENYDKLESWSKIAFDLLNKEK